MPRMNYRIIPSAVAGAVPTIISWFNYFAPHKYEGTNTRWRNKEKKFGVFTENHSYGYKKHAAGGRK